MNSRIARLPLDWSSRWFQALRAMFGAKSTAEFDALPVRVHGTEFTRTTASPVHVKGFDQPLVWVTFGLLMIGLVMVYSASIALPDNPRTGGNYSSSYFLIRHTVSLMVAFVAAVIAFQIPLNTWERIGPWVFVVSIALLIVELIPYVGKTINGARRWISLGDRKSTRLNSSHSQQSRMPSSA